MDYILNLFHLYAGKGTVMALYLFAWALIVVLEKKKSHKIAFAFSAWYLPLVILNPLVGIILDRLSILPERIVRLYWLLPVFPVIAYGLSLLSQKAEKKWRAGSLVTAALAIGLVLVGEPMVTGDNFVRAENLYKLPDGVIEIVDMINADALSRSGGEGSTDSEGSVGGKGAVDGEATPADRKSVMPLELSTYARQYDGSLLMLYGRYPTQNNREIEAYNLMGQQQVPVDRVAELAREENCRYLVLDSAKEWENMPGEDVLTPVGSYGNYCLYRLN